MPDADWIPTWSMAPGSSDTSRMTAVAPLWTALLVWMDGWMENRTDEPTTSVFNAKARNYGCDHMVNPHQTGLARSRSHSHHSGILVPEQVIDSESGQ